MTPTERQRARELADAASPGPWKLGMYRGFGGREEGEHDIRGQDGRELAGVRAMFARRADAEFVAEVRTLVPRLLDALEAAERDRAEMQRLLALSYDYVGGEFANAELAEDVADYFTRTEEPR